MATHSLSQHAGAVGVGEGFGRHDFRAGHDGEGMQAERRIGGGAFVVAAAALAFLVAVWWEKRRGFTEIAG